jgi:peptide/nickel transport system substrate-binding protein
LPSAPPSGGTLHLAALSRSALQLDPQSAEGVFSAGLELFRCCLYRTLLSYEGRSTEDGGTDLHPDVAADLPEVSADGLTWTFRLKPDVHYAPPLQDLAVTSRDFVRSFERLVSLGGYLGAEFGALVRGAAEFSAGDAATISGFETPDDQTLVVHLVRPSGDLPNRFALTSVPPIPPLRDDPGARFGAAEGHDADWERFFVATGPYMVEGADEIDFGLPPAQQSPARGYEPGSRITLVRNPAWAGSSDRLRPAFVDRIEIELGSIQDEAAYAERVDRGELDLVIETKPPPQAPLAQIEEWQADPDRRDQVFVNERDFVRAITFNLALPPLDDLHVRRAISYIIDKRRLRELAGGPVVGEIAGHAALNSLEDNLLLGYDALPTPDHAGDIELARDEMRQSRYDEDGDGRCDADACHAVSGVTFDLPPFGDQSAVVAENLAEIGIDIEVEVPEDVFNVLGDPTERVAIGIGPAWGKDLPNASTFFQGLYSGDAIALGNNYALLGATPDQLAEWGYSVTSVPSIDDRIAACIPELGSEQTRCWAELDQYLMEEVVPIVPYLFESHVQLVGDRVVHYAYDQSAALPALDRIAVAGDSD